MRYDGSCHCGRIAFAVEGELSGAIAGNCSIYSRKGALLWFVPAERMTLRAAGQDLGVYTFNRHVIRHVSCRTCGIHTHGEGTDTNGNRIAAINIRCLEGIDLAAIPVQPFDGRSL